MDTLSVVSNRWGVDCNTSVPSSKPWQNNETEKTVKSFHSWDDCIIRQSQCLQTFAVEITTTSWSSHNKPGKATRLSPIEVPWGSELQTVLKYVWKIPKYLPRSVPIWKITKYPWPRDNIIFSGRDWSVVTVLWNYQIRGKCKKKSSLVDVDVQQGV